MGDFFADPDYPDRPQHPDYWRLSEVLHKMDGDSTEGGKPADEIIASFADPDSVAYAARQRSLMMQKMTGIPAEVLEVVWLDAFTAGVSFEKAGGHRRTEESTG